MEIEIKRPAPAPDIDKFVPGVVFRSGVSTYIVVRNVHGDSSPGFSFYAVDLTSESFPMNVILFTEYAIEDNHTVILGTASKLSFELTDV